MGELFAPTGASSSSHQREHAEELWATVRGGLETRVAGWNPLSSTRMVCGRPVQAVILTFTEAPLNGQMPYFHTRLKPLIPNVFYGRSAKAEPKVEARQCEWDFMQVLVVLFGICVVFTFESFNLMSDSRLGSLCLRRRFQTADR